MPTEIANISKFQVASPVSTKSSPPVRSTVKSESSAAAQASRQNLPGGNAAVSALAAQALSAEQKPERKEVSAEELEQAVNSINSHVQNLQRSLHFSVDEELGRTIVKVLDSETEEVIRQIPTEEVLAIAHTIEKMSPENQENGLFFEGQA